MDKLKIRFQTKEDYDEFVKRVNSEQGLEVEIKGGEYEEWRPTQVMRVKTLSTLQKI